MIISKHVILTAAHCVDIEIINEKGGIFSWYIAAKEHDFTDRDKADYHKICKVLVHDKWDREANAYDFALLFLKTEITFDKKAKKLCLPTPKLFPSNSLVGKQLRVSGWGQVNATSASVHGLRDAEVYAISNEKCKKKYHGKKEIRDWHLCAGDRNGNNEDFLKNKDSCHGDSGGK